MQDDFDRLLGEHIALSRQYGAVQERCSRVVAAQRAEVARLEAEIVRLRAAVVLRDTALAAVREDRAAFEASIPGLPRRAVLTRRVDALLARIQSLMRERLHWQWHGSQASPGATAPVAAAKALETPAFLTATDVRQKAVLCLGDATHTTVTRRVVEMAGGAMLRHVEDSDDSDDLAALEASLVAADLVICQTGCLSHGAYWRVQDHCKRTGKTCVMVDQPQVIRIVRGADQQVAERA